VSEQELKVEIDGYASFTLSIQPCDCSDGDHIILSQGGEEIANMFQSEAVELRDALSATLSATSEIEGVEQDQPLEVQVAELRERVTSLEQHVIEEVTAPYVAEVEATNEPQPVDQNSLEAELDQYIEHNVPLVLDYTNEAGERRNRIVSPYSIYRTLGYPRKVTLEGWSHEHDEYRQYRLDRIHGLAPAAEKFRGAVTR
jgi:predicted DNA-binding transcriptional regulator YafY